MTQRTPCFILVLRVIKCRESTGHSQISAGLAVVRLQVHVMESLLKFRIAGRLKWLVYRGSREIGWLLLQPGLLQDQPWWPPMTSPRLN